jgi:small conductance mechanosensitive channel
MDTNINPEQAVETVQNYARIISGLDWKTAVTAVAILVLGFLLVKLVLRLESRALEKSRFLPPSTHAMIKTLSKVLLYLVVLITAAGYVGIPMTSFVAVLSVVGIAVSLAVQGLLGNLVGGFIILGARPLEVGQFVETSGVMGTVDRIGMVYTRLVGIDGRLIYLPNSALYTSQVVNYSQYGKRRVTAVISVQYGFSPEEVREAIQLAISRVEGIHQDPAPMIWLDSFGDSGIVYNAHVWCDGSAFLRVKYALNDALWHAFREKGVTIPYPHLQVLMGDDSPQAKQSQ